MVPQKKWITIGLFEYKECCRCKRLLPSNNFHKRNNRPGGTASWCKQCKKETTDREKIKIYHKSHLIKRNKQQREYYKKNRIKILEQKKEYHKKDYVKFSRTIRHANRRCKIKGTDDKTVTAKAMRELLELQNRKCKICNCDLKENVKHLDHIIPIIKGGCHTISNMQWLCKQCNLLKGIKIYPLSLI